METDSAFSGKLQLITACPYLLGNTVEWKPIAAKRESLFTFSPYLLGNTVEWKLRDCYCNLLLWCRSLFVGEHSWMETRRTWAWQYSRRAVPICWGTQLNGNNGSCRDQLMRVHLVPICWGTQLNGNWSDWCSHILSRRVPICWGTQLNGNTTALAEYC